MNVKNPSSTELPQVHKILRMGFYVRTSLPLALFTMLISVTTFAQTYEQAVQELQHQEINRLTESLKTLHQDPPKCSLEKPEPPVQARAYECEIVEIPVTQEDPKKDPPKKTAKKEKLAPTHPDDEKNQIHFFLDNDNLLFGLAKSGDDEGMTHRAGLGYLRRFKENESIAFDVSSELYTREANWIWEEKDAMAARLTGSHATIKQVAEGGDKIPINYIDVSRFKATYAKGDTFYFKAALGTEIRTTTTDKGKLSPAAWMQNTLHETANIYTYRYVPSEGVAPVSTVEKNTITQKNGYEKDKKLQAMTPVSVLADASVGTTLYLFEGRCKLQFETGGSISTEHGQLVGPNSSLKASTKISTDIARRKDGTPILTASAGGVIFYFPVPGDVEQKTGSQTSVSIQSTHRMGKKGNTLQPFFTFWLPNGRQVFTTMDDSDVIQRFGMRFNFGK